MLLNNDNTRLTPAGDLEINVSAIHGLCIYYKPWDQALEVYVNDIDGEVNVFRIDPDIPILSQASNCAAGSDLNVFVGRIPQQIRRVAASFVFNQTLVLQWAARYQAANDLISSNPILLWLLVNASQSRCWREDYIRKILSLRQDAIIGELTGKACKPAVKILRKINLKEGSQREYGFIMWGLKQDGVLDAVRHLKTIPVQILAMLFHVPELITGKAACMIGNSLPEQIGVLDAMAEATRIHRIQEDTINLGRTLGFVLPQQIVANCSSVRQLDQLHEKWTEHLNNGSFAAIEKCFFPEPPLAGTDSIVPITNTFDLLQEGRVMHHCVGGYSGSVLNSECFVYKVLRPQRATLALRIRGKSLTVADLRTFKNGRPSGQCREIVEQWLHPERDLEKCLPQSLDTMGR